MYKNEYLEKGIENAKGNEYLLRGYIHTQNNKYNELVINDLGFISNNIDELKNFKDELVKANIKKFILTESSSGLMSNLHWLDKVSIKIKGVKKVSYIDKWEKEECFKEGLEMIVK
ncbi:hypothetical protein [Clostridium rectalis]|uniref:hypothetical protein n=1 Tax=Clostridium rectalis TaxID=2040295 RepID=UPI000F63CDC3|nr:hypothetical protein [Clostridium rectalis]